MNISIQPWWGDNHFIHRLSVAGVEEVFRRSATLMILHCSTDPAFKPRLKYKYYHERTSFTAVLLFKSLLH